ncbi:MAG: CBS domain-containing protein [Thauera sp.]|jgi:acetoin utilization protein AcuB|nr:CBS domain-containing protein [Thauera sp.]
MSTGWDSDWNSPVDEFTTPDPVTVAEDLPIDELKRLMDEYGVRHLPVVRDGRVVGLVSDRDVRLARGLSADHQLQVSTGDIMATDPVAVLANAPLDEVALLMSERKIGSVIVNGEEGEFRGIFTLTDALNALVEISRTARRRA